MFSIICSQYHHVNQTIRHIQAVIKNFPALKLTRKDFSEQYKELTSNFENFKSVFWLLVHRNGTKEKLACFCGTIPVFIKGSFMKLTVCHLLL